jgi:hypothetical protein
MILVSQSSVEIWTGGLRPAGPPIAVARGDPKAPLRSGGCAAAQLVTKLCLKPTQVDFSV